MTITLLLTTILSACGTMGGASSDATQKAQEDKLSVLMVFSEREQAGTPLFRSTMYVNDDYLYIDDDSPDEGYILFDRKKQTIYSVAPTNKTVFVIKPKPVTIDPPIAIDYQVEAQPSSAIPKVSGRTATHYRYDVNGAHCYDAVTLEKSFLPGVVKALKEYRTVLAGEHASTLLSMPMDTHEACDLAVNVFHATQHLDTGLPLREWDQNGKLKFMVDYRVGYDFDESKLTVPEDYREFSVEMKK
ncbi:MAG: hypothetical protein PVH04_08880 [Gammaproteobacteria bacterium]